jgi:transcriptional regulator with XRE-family HTH domain
MTDDGDITAGGVDRRATKAELAGRARAGYLARRMGTTLKDARLAHGMRQRDVAERAGVSQPEIAKLERAGGANTALAVWAACGSAVGLQLAAFFEAAPGADLPRDIEHLRRQNLVIVTATPGGWRGEPEASLPDDGPRPRSIDVLLTRRVRREAAIVEIWDLLLDGGAAMRGLEAKVVAVRGRVGPEWQVEGLLIVRGTLRNRRLISVRGALSSLVAGLAQGARRSRRAHAEGSWLRLGGRSRRATPRGTAPVAGPACITGPT